MSNLTSLNIKIDRNVKSEADAIANAMGMTLSTAINVFVRQMIKERAIPFKVQADNKSDSLSSLIDSIREETKEIGFLSDEEIYNEIQAIRTERKTQGKE